MRVPSSQQRRWAVLLAALVTTLAATFFGSAPVEVVGVNARRTSAQPEAAAQRESAVEAAPVFEEQAATDPFEKRGWAEPPPSPPAPVKAPPAVDRAVLPVAVDPPGPPPLPYRYVGSFSDDAGAVIYLARGEVAVVARVGETLDGNYKILALQARSVEFEHISTGTKQMLPIPGAE
jgi:hypothetical protein